jgi:hypothetical protein
MEKDRSKILELSPLSDPKLTSQQNIDYFESLSDYLENGTGNQLWKFQNFAKYVPRQNLTLFLVRNEMFKKILQVPGSVVECGCWAGGGLMTFAQLSAIYEPVHHYRKIIGFDTFAGTPELSGKDLSQQSAESGRTMKGSFPSGQEAYDDLLRATELYDMNRSLPHIEKVKLVKGDVRESIPSYLNENPHTAIALLYLDMGPYEATKCALQCLYPRMVKGGIIAFDHLNDFAWPGETTAALEEFGLNNLRLKREIYDTKISYAVVGE